MHHRSSLILVAVLTCTLASGCVYDSGGSYLNVTDNAREGIVRSANGAIQTRQFDDLDAFFVADYVRETDADPNGNVSSLAEFKEYLRSRERDFAFEQIVLDRVESDTNIVSFEGTYTLRRIGERGEIRPDAPRAVVSFHGTHRFVQGKITRTWISWDHEDAMRQIGAMERGESLEESESNGR